MNADTILQTLYRSAKLIHAWATEDKTLCEIQPAENAPIVREKKRENGRKTMRLEGREAIEYAATNGLLLNKYADPTENARDGLTVDEARAIAREDPKLIYLDAGERADRQREKGANQ